MPTASVNGVPFLISNLNAAGGEFALLNDASAASVVVIDFTFDVVDAYAADQHRTRVTSTSDAGGEWVGLVEVASETDPSASSTSNVFRGEVGLSSDAAVETPGDGVVLARPGDTLTMTYYQADGVTPISSHAVSVKSASAIDVPMGGWIDLSVLAAALALAGLPRMRGISVAPR